MATLGTMFPARWGLVWSQMSGVLSEVRALHPLGGLVSGLYLECSGWGYNGRAGGPLPSPHLTSLTLPSSSLPSPVFPFLRSRPLKSS